MLQFFKIKAVEGIVNFKMVKNCDYFMQLQVKEKITTSVKIKIMVNFKDCDYFMQLYFISKRKKKKKIEKESNIIKIIYNFKKNCKITYIIYNKRLFGLFVSALK